jgi:hypothetical protein
MNKNTFSSTLALTNRIISNLILDLKDNDWNTLMSSHY